MLILYLYYTYAHLKISTHKEELYFLLTILLMFKPNLWCLTQFN